MSKYYQSVQDYKKALRVQKQTKAQIKKQVQRGYKFNQRTLRKIDRLVNTPTTQLRPFEVKYLEQFKTQELALRKARSFIDNPTGTVMSKAKGLVYSQVKEKAVKSIVSLTDFSEKEAGDIVNLVSKAFDPSEFIKEGAKLVANSITESVGLGNLGGTVVDVVASILSDKAGANEEIYTSEDVNLDQYIEESLDTGASKQAKANTDAYSKFMAEPSEGKGFFSQYPKNEESKEEEEDTKKLSGVESINQYIEEIKEHTSVEYVQGSGKYYDTSRLVEEAVMILRTHARDEDEADRYIEEHPYSEFYKKLDTATKVPGSSQEEDEERESDIEEAFNLLISWLH